MHRRRCPFILLLLGGILLVSHPWWLRAAALLLQIPKDPVTAQHWLIHSGDGCFQVAGEAYQRGDAEHFYYEPRPLTRLMRLGILPSSEDVTQTQLVRQAIDPQRIHRLQLSDAAAVRAWRQQHPGARLKIVCDAFVSRRLRRSLSSGLPPEDARVLLFLPLPDRRYHAGNWWRSRAGWKAFGEQLIALAYQAGIGGRARDTRILAPDEYEAWALDASATP